MRHVSVRCMLGQGEGVSTAVSFRQRHEEAGRKAKANGGKEEMENLSRQVPYCYYMVNIYRESYCRFYKRRHATDIMFRILICL